MHETQPKYPAASALTARVPSQFPSHALFRAHFAERRGLVRQTVSWLPLDDCVTSRKIATSEEDASDEDTLLCEKAYCPVVKPGIGLSTFRMEC